MQEYVMLFYTNEAKNRWKSLNLEKVVYDSKYKTNGFQVIACGPTERETIHASIYQDDKLIHDPYKGGNGLLKIKTYTLFFITDYTCYNNMVEHYAKSYHLPS